MCKCTTPTSKQSRIAREISPEQLEDLVAALVATTLSFVESWAASGDQVERREARSTHAAPAPIQLTPREAEVAQLVARGMTNRQIAHELVIATSTVERHIANILGKLDIRSRSQLAVWSVHHNRSRPMDIWTRRTRSA
jgi:DNA-binding NarL/FixJ family response regulator